ncbi:MULTISPECIES: hypothetical protein [Parachlamydia]|nr:hypothetical protein [Parachlamydia acanthamoebae]EFB41010.1 hypothetical protein pah_c161o012 [Parachlamydia acanthamoebae str. Hall's coccus]KIA76910.1 hypothetical protein DB43_HD00360 [Parachlamydia acanthamoebae]
MMKSPLRVVKLEDAIPLQASKWLNLQLLISSEQMESLFEELGLFYIYSIGRVVECGAGEILRDDFLKAYKDYIQTLLAGKLPDYQITSTSFSSIFTSDLDALYCIQTGENQQLVRIGKPVIQVQAHTLDYSPLDGKFRSMIFGQDHIPWGIQFSYPQIHQDGKDVVQTLHRKDLNTELFRRLQTWVRLNTIPTAFSVDEKKINVPVRIGKDCFSWINQHCQLVKKNLRVIV